MKSKIAERNTVPARKRHEIKLENFVDDENTRFFTELTNNARLKALYEGLEDILNMNLVSQTKLFQNIF